MTQTLTARQQMLLTLCGDLNAIGWNQQHKLWWLTGTDDDEWLTFVGEFSGEPDKHLLGLLNAKAVLADTRGVVIASEGWTYPQRVLDSLKDRPAHLAAYTRTLPPDEHPERVEFRHLLLACSDGEVLALTYPNAADAELSWARIDASTPANDATVDAARAVLGLNDDLARRSNQVEGIAVLRGLLDTLDEAVSSNATEEEATRALFLAMPERVRIQLIEQMPEDVKATLRRALTEEERRQYGL